MKKKLIYILYIVLGILFLDQITKMEVSSSIRVNNSITVIENFLSFTYSKNDGAAFGILSGNVLLLIIISIIIFVYLIFEIKKTDNGKMLICYSLIMGGLFGNLIDRVFLGYVRDFISFTIFGRSMAIFNIADACLVIGTILLIIYTIKESINENKNRKE